ncbi:MAG: UDP-2,3-diacylglucosamine diphosphatase [Pseudobdellovibrionaceae bacterium]|nr:UDP-2,3-diacylglucosamine diphosphatase [Pseudobdellovibrionaceae bacterium]
MAVAWFVSDCHLLAQGEDDRRQKLFLGFLRQLGTAKRPATHLFLLGDIFDMWVGSSLYFYRIYSCYVDVLAELYARGIHIVYLEGNHDIHVADFWRKRGVEVSQNDRCWMINGKKVYITHGDFINAAETGYHKYIRFVRSPLAKKIIDFFPGYFWFYLGRLLSKRSRRSSMQKYLENRQMLPQIFQAYAKELYQKEKYDFLISGHIHVWLRTEITPGVWAFNLGSWLDEPGAFCLKESGFYWESLDDSK